MKPLLVFALLALSYPGRTAAQDVKPLLDRIGTTKGLCVVLGDDGKLAVELARKSELLLYVQSPDVVAVRKTADEASLLGVRVFVQQGPWDKLHLADNLADAVVLTGAAVGKAARADLLRVLRPEGKLIEGERVVASKPFPKDTDDWSHPYHGPDNNPQSRDRVARAPYLTHFLAEPWYCPMPLVTVTSGGRLFKAFGHLAVKEREWPWLNSLIAQNAFNGTILWKRPLSDGYMIHRNTLIATPTILYLGDNVSCKLLDAATGKVVDEIKVPADLGDGPAWKWMALVDNVLFAMVGKDETPDPTLKGGRQARGWPWRGGALGQGYDSATYPWGFGNTILAIDPTTKKVLWSHQEKERLDSRGMCLTAGRLVFYSHGKFLGCLNARTGKEEWRSTDADTLKAIGEHKQAQNPNEGFSSTVFVKGNEQALYFAGPTRTDLAAVSMKDGKLLWKVEKRGNSQLVLREDGLYAMSPVGSTRFDYLTGKVLQELGPRVNCTRATGSCDSIFVRGGRDGTMRYDLLGDRMQHLCPMRPSCQDGVIPSYGHLYWGPWMCDCNLTLVGVIALAPAGSFDFDPKIDDKDRLETSGPLDRVEELSVGEADWPTLRANNQRSAYVPVAVPEKTSLRWTVASKSGLPATAPIAAGGLIFTGGGDGVLRAVDAKDGAVRWTFATGGALTYPPAVWRGRLIAGSGDGYVYALEARTGRLLWRFRAAPVERTIPVYGSLRSSWPVASGVAVEDGIVYAAAGLANHDGTHVYALDAISGKVRWHNGASGAIHPKTAGGVSVNGHLLLHGKKLHLAGGNVVAVASYDLDNGKCLTDPQAPMSHTSFRAGSDLFVQDDKVNVAGQPLYSSRGDYRMVDRAVLQTPVGEVQASLALHNTRVELVKGGAKPIWSKKAGSRIHALAVAKNAVLVASSHDPLRRSDRQTSTVQALSLKDGEVLWQHTLPAAAAQWGLAVDRAGRVIVTLEDGRVLGYAAD